MTPQIGVTSEAVLKALQLTSYGPNLDRRYVTIQCNAKAWRYTPPPLGGCNDACNGRSKEGDGER